LCTDRLPSLDFPGFSNPWKKISIQHDAILKARIGWQGLTTAEYRTSGDYLLVGGTEFRDGTIDWEACPFVDKWRYDQDENIKLRVGDVLITKDGTIGKVAFVQSLPRPATLNSGVFVIRPRNPNFYPIFLYFILRSHSFDEFLQRLAAGSTITHLYQKDFVMFEFLAPDLPEQSAIGSTLVDMDAEIAVLEKMRDKVEAVKQGMTQVLLTGKVRLIQREVNA
jgi:type I restriction enzyme S subunit